MTFSAHRGYSLLVDYTQLFRNLREARGLTLEQLARLARVHRNTVVNIESGRQVKFKTIAALMHRMGYAEDSAELRSIALLWLEAVSGIAFSRVEQEAAAQKTISALRGATKDRTVELQRAIAASNLSPAEIDLLTFAARRPELLSILKTVRGLVRESADESRSPALLQAAEERAPYGRKK